MQHNQHEIDVSSVYSINTEAGGIEKGDVLTYDLAYQIRLFPWELPAKGIPSQINFDIELNGLFEQRAEH